MYQFYFLASIANVTFNSKPHGVVYIALNFFFVFLSFSIIIIFWGSISRKCTFICIDISSNRASSKLTLLYSVDPCREVKCEYNAKCRSLPNDTALCECQDDCSTEPVEPVCGSDMVTYPNECALKAKSCMEKRMTTVKSKRICRKYL